jgi:menaquinone-dependent protoporphyrinogen IX oxidase
MPGTGDPSMKILIAYYSRTGYTGILAERVARELRLRSHTVVLERLELVDPLRNTTGFERIRSACCSPSGGSHRR